MIFFTFGFCLRLLFFFRFFYLHLSLYRRKVLVWRFQYYSFHNVCSNEIALELNEKPFFFLLHLPKSSASLIFHLVCVCFFRGCTRQIWKQYWLVALLKCFFVFLLSNRIFHFEYKKKSLTAFNTLTLPHAKAYVCCCMFFCRFGRQRHHS